MCFAVPDSAASLDLIVERHNRGRVAWIPIAGADDGTTARGKNSPASGSRAYRISYVAADGKVGPPSAAFMVSLPGK